MSKYYLTTPIYYVNAAPHIGHTYTTIAADAIKRWKTAQGFDCVLTTGTDEHGQKIARAAAAQNKQPKEFTDIIAAEFKRVWDQMGFAIDHFKRTTDADHAANVQSLFHACKQAGYVYPGSYSGCYCFFDELYVNDAKPGDPCPDCGRPIEGITEENYYFKLSAFTDRLRQFHLDNPDWCQPEIRRNEVMAFLNQEGGLKDLSISRSTVKWGIPVPDAPGQVFYVWFDALMTYHTAVLNQSINGEPLWPADLHLIGKEILRFHAIYWPAFLMAAAEAEPTGKWALPKKVFAHGWLLFENDKMSKSKGNIVRATPIQQVMGADALRYFLLREVPFGSDGSFSFDALVTRYNADLANGLGNLAARVMALLIKSFGGMRPNALEYPRPQLFDELMRKTEESARAAYERFEFAKALESIWNLIGELDRRIVEAKPWSAVAISAGAGHPFGPFLGGCFDALQLICRLAEPVIPDSCARLAAMLGDGTSPVQPSHLFPRLDAKEVIPKMLELEKEELARQAQLLGKAPVEEVKAEAPAAPVKMMVDGVADLAPEITIDDFIKVDLRVGIIVSAEAVPKADKLLHLKIDIGEAKGPRTIVAGIALAYKPEQLVGRKVAIVANLAPRKLRGIESQGMIVAASLEGGSPALVSFLEEVPVGARLK